jgi:hypothetical protein
VPPRTAFNEVLVAPDAGRNVGNTTFSPSGVASDSERSCAQSEDPSCCISHTGTEECKEIKAHPNQNWERTMQALEHPKVH